MTHEIDAELERLRGLVADHTALFNRFGVIGRELALADQDVRDAEAVTNSNRHEAGKRKWQRGSTNISALNNTAKDLIELRQRADVLRCDRERVSAEYQYFGRPAQEYAALLERKIELLASSPDHAGEEVRGLQASKQSYIDYAERVNAALSAGNDAARELVAMTTILRLERGNAVSWFVVFGGVIGAVGCTNCRRDCSCTTAYSW